MWEHCTFGNQIFGCGKVYYSNSIILTNFMQTLIPNRLFENVYLRITLYLLNYLEKRKT
jgi:hypothetical protein